MGNNKVGNGVGCTANVLLITPDKYYIANAGDSRSALYRDGRLVTFSEDHKPESPIEEQRITKAGGMITMGRVNGGLNLSRSFGDFDYKRNVDLGYDEQMITCKPDIKEIGREKGDDFILMGCDGIWERYVEDSFGLLELVK
jgi:protein phosphatase 2C family protein 2/3